MTMICRPNVPSPPTIWKEKKNWFINRPMVAISSVCSGKLPNDTMINNKCIFLAHTVYSLKSLSIFFDTCESSRSAEYFSPNYFFPVLFRNRLAIFYFLLQIATFPAVIWLSGVIRTERYTG